MPMPCLLSIYSLNHSPIEGSGKVVGHAGMILVQAVEHLIDIPVHTQAGLPAGKRAHKGMILSKEIDKSSPIMLQAGTESSHLTQAEELTHSILQYLKLILNTRRESVPINNCYFPIHLATRVSCDGRVSLAMY